MAIHIALALALIGCLGLTAVLLAWADRVAGATLLVLFLGGVSTWIIGNELPSWFGPKTERAALALLASAPLTAAVFVHFASVFTRGRGAHRLSVPLAYAVGATAALVSLLSPPGAFEPFADVAYVAIPNLVGWTASLIWGGLSAVGHLILGRAWQRLPPGSERRQLVAVFASSAWGLFCTSGYLGAALRIDIYPWPLLGLPLYPVLLVYGVLRYRVLVTNAWARRALAWALLVACAALAIAAMPLLLHLTGIPASLLPWLSGIAAAGAFVVLGGPLRRLAERLVYPGGAVSAADVVAWRAELDAAEDPSALTAIAARLLAMRLRAPVRIEVGTAAAGAEDAPRLLCRPDAGPPASWRTVLDGWGAAPPGPRRAAELFGSVLADAADRISREAASAERARLRAEQARLAELGQLAATVVHDIRNPLNIIGMAAAAAPVETRAEIREQVARIARLAQDLLDYAKPWRIEPVALDLAALVRDLAGHYPTVEIGPGLAAPLTIRADPRRLQQALANLLDNAAASVRESAARVLIDAECAAGGKLQLRVADNGVGVPADMRGALFTPFASRTPGGTGLGLAIVAKVAQAHGGAVALEERPGWATCFTLTLPCTADEEP